MLYVLIVWSVVIGVYDSNNRLLVRTCCLLK